MLAFIALPIWVCQFLSPAFRFLAFLTGLKVALGLGIWQAFWCSALGCFVFRGDATDHYGRPGGNWCNRTTVGNR